MKHYFVKYGDFANTYALRFSEDVKDAPGWERLTRKEAEALARRERQRRKEDPNFSGYADAEITPLCPEIDF